MKNYFIDGFNIFLAKNALVIIVIFVTALLLKTLYVIEKKSWIDNRWREIKKILILLSVTGAFIFGLCLAGPWVFEKISEDASRVAFSIGVAFFAVMAMLALLLFIISYAEMQFKKEQRKIRRLATKGDKFEIAEAVGVTGLQETTQSETEIGSLMKKMGISNN